jgi:hypothetical protein
MLESLERRRAAGQFLVAPGLDSNIAQVEIDGDTAVVLDCSLDTGVVYGPDGEVVFDAATIHKYRETHLILVDDRWLVEDYYIGGHFECDPEEVAS